MTAAWEKGELLAPIAPDAPCGRSLEDTAILASFDAFRLFGQATPFDPVPDWSAIREASLAALRESRDLRLLAHLSSALLRTDGLPAFAATLGIASAWLTSYWNETHPGIDEDAILRRNALNCFADQMAIVDGLRRLPLVKSRQHGTFSLRDLDVASGQIPPAEGEARPDPRDIAAAFAAMPGDELVQLRQSAADALAALRDIDARMRGEGGSAAAPTFDALAAQLTRIDRTLRDQLATRTPSAAAADAEAASMENAAVAVGAIRSRDDAVRALEAVARFFRETEPSSPVPLFLDRAKRLVSKDFLEVLADVAPDALAHARAAGGLRSAE
jgi:type VI secretion system protein ImpA